MTDLRQIEALYAELAPQTAIGTTMLPVEDDNGDAIDLLSAGAPGPVDLTPSPVESQADIEAEAAALFTMLTEMVNLTSEAIVLIPEHDMLRAELVVTRDEATAILARCKPRGAAAPRIAPASPWGGVARVVSADERF
jgi:hypothetical protein